MVEVEKEYASKGVAWDIAEKIDIIFCHQFCHHFSFCFLFFIAVFRFSCLAADFYL